MQNLIYFSSYAISIGINQKKKKGNIFFLLPLVPTDFIILIPFFQTNVNLRFLFRHGNLDERPRLSNVFSRKRPLLKSRDYGVVAFGMHHHLHVGRPHWRGVRALPLFRRIFPRRNEIDFEWNYSW